MQEYLRGMSILAAVAIFAFALSYKGVVTASELPATAYFGDVSLKIEYATSTASRTLGLGDRTSIPEDYGMLFVFPKDDFYGFWMKDTLVPLDMFWLDAQGHVVSIAAGVTPETYPHVFYPSVPARYVLETAAGFAEAHGIEKGTPLLLKKFPVVLK